MIAISATIIAGLILMIQQFFLLLGYDKLDDYGKPRSKFNSKIQGVCWHLY